MKAIGLTGTLATMSLALISSAAAERAVNQHGSACAPVYGNNTTYPYNTGLNGIAWTGTTQTYFHCPAPAPVESDANGIATSNVKLLKMYVEDGSTTQTFRCQGILYAQDGSGFTATSQKYACSVAGGCVDSTTAFSGETTFEWPINWVTSGSWVMFQCLTPGKNPTSSYISSYRVVYQ